MQTNEKTLGLYLHVPFCRSKCLYCDFCSLPNCGEETVGGYVHALCRDLRDKSPACRDYTVDTVYFGGGTPTYLSVGQLERIMQEIGDCYRISGNAEITAECNPATGNRETFRQMRTMGFNRLSIGLQSVHERELKALGRIHSFGDFCRTWEDARRAGFENLSVDLMSGIPEQTPESWEESLRQVLRLTPEHVSAYGLIIEEGTPFAKREKTLVLPDEESAREMYFSGIEILATQGILQYEISNFAKKGMNPATTSNTGAVMSIWALERRRIRILRGSGLAIPVTYSRILRERISPRSGSVPTGRSDSESI
ncbi:MAG: radical SAM family heme chaperone HemW [Clostridia bacterium]|nr:radical SAM family heme chaperone HemW [Clostridia bacterium]